LLQIAKAMAKRKQKEVQKSVMRLAELGFSVRLTPTQ
jgi:hypothetical protein